MLKGIQFVVDEQGKRKAVQIDVKMYGDLWEDFYDMIIALERESEPCETLEEVKKRLLIKMDTRSRYVLCLKTRTIPLHWKSARSISPSRIEKQKNTA